MPLENRPEQPARSHDELLEMAESFAERARNNYGTRDHGNEYAQTAALISLAGSAVVIARMLVAQNELMNVVNRPDLPMPIEPQKPEGA